VAGSQASAWEPNLGNSSFLCRLAKLSLANADTTKIRLVTSEQDYHKLLDSLNQIKMIVTKSVKQPSIRKQRTFGSAKGSIKIADDFDALGDDFQDYM
jgi:hypothetical protein